MMPTAGGRVEVPGRLVGEQDQRPVDERPGDRHALLLTTGELVTGSGRALPGQADQVEHLRAPGLRDDVAGRPMTSRAKATFS